MAAIIQLIDNQALEKAIRVFRHYGDAVPTGEPDRFYVSDHVIKQLTHKGITFLSLSPRDHELPEITEAMFDSLRKAVRESHRKKIIRVENPKSLDDIINA
jgi:hypothetical protein